MRLHCLTVTAFGPFADTVEVDFDALATGGLFLLTGATGAGKSSVLDAVCFALYGQVPGDRAGAKHLRSDHAPADREPRVVLELSIGERRFRFSRSPSWSRPKRRGEGTTTIPAHVVVEEQRAGVWAALTNRLDDAGLLVGDLLGMSCSQFVQVAMLPQGRFQAFLRATSTERHAVLQRLFRTDRFERVEKWLAERRTTDRRAVEAGEQAVLGVLHRIEEAAGTNLPEWTGGLAEATDSGDVTTWSTALRAAATAAVDEVEPLLAEAEATDQTARETLAEARAREALVRRATAADSDLVALAEEADALGETRAALERHRRATSIQPLADRVRVTAAERQSAADRWVRRVEALVSLRDVDLTEEPTRSDLTKARRAAADALATAQAFAPRQRELEEGERLLRETQTALAQVETEVSAAERTLAALPERLARAEAQRERASAAAARVPGAQAHTARMRDLVEASDRLSAVTAELATARADLRVATDLALSAKQHHLQVWEARIKGMAAELAGDLASGCGCPVCGSVDHPAPARRSTTSVGSDDESAARRASEDAGFAQLNHELKVASLETEQTGLAERLAEHDTTTLPASLDAARAEVEALTAEATQATSASSAVAELRAALTTTTGQVEALRVRRTTLHAEIGDREDTLSGLRQERLALLDDRADDLETLVALLERTVEELDRALADSDSLSLAGSAADQAATALDEAARTAGFADADDAVAALLDEAEADRRARALADADARRIAAEATLADPEVRAAVEVGAPDVAALAAEHERAAAALRTCATRADVVRKQQQRLAHLDERLAERLTEWEPLRARHRLSGELASLAEGRSAENPLKMRLAAYVLAERLRQVVAAANERLSRMTGERYALEHVADRGVGEQRGGLSLRVRDDWNGVHRDPATLSGGETFVVSLALALGLADTVAHEAGGTDIDTLFIDEGFGSLDSDTLEDVMDTLDSLRDGGRVVGLVSHVPELRNRITTQLEVVKGRNGSTLRPVLAGN